MSFLTESFDEGTTGISRRETPETIISRQDLVDLGQVGIKKWEKKNAELLSCYDSAKLRSLMGTFSEIETDVNPVRDLLNEKGLHELPERDQFNTVIDAVEHSFNLIFLTLLDRSTLGRLLIVSEAEITDEAEKQLSKMRQDVHAYEANQRARQQEAAAIAAEPETVVEDPQDVCVREFHNLGSAAFRAKYISNTANRHIYESCVSQGRI